MTTPTELNYSSLQQKINFLSIRTGIDLSREKIDENIAKVIVESFSKEQIKFEKNNRRTFSLLEDILKRVSKTPKLDTLTSGKLLRLIVKVRKAQITIGFPVEIISNIARFAPKNTNSKNETRNLMSPFSLLLTLLPEKYQNRIIINSLIDHLRVNGDLAFFMSLGIPEEQLIQILNEISPEMDKNYSLYWACMAGKIEVVKARLAKYKTNFTDEDSIPLLLAAKFGHTDIVNLLLNLKDENGKMVVYPVANRYKALLHAAKYGFADIVKLLLNLKDENGEMVVYPVANRNSVLSLASNHGHTDTVGLLLNLKDDNGEMLVRPDANNYRALCLATKNGYAEIIKLFFDVKDENGNMIVHPSWRNYKVLREASSLGHADIVKYFLSLEDDDDDVSCYIRSRTRALNNAVYSYRTEIVKLLLPLKTQFKNNRFVNFTNIYNGCFESAVRMRHIDIVKFLLTVKDEKGKMLVNLTRFNYYALTKLIEQVIECEDCSIVNMLLSAKDEKGKMLVDPTLIDYCITEKVVKNDYYVDSLKVLFNIEGEDSSENTPTTNYGFSRVPVSHYSDVINLLNGLNYKNVKAILDPTNRYNYALCMAVKHKKLSLAKQLLTLKDKTGKMLVDPTAGENDAFKLAAQSGYISMVKLLLDLKDKTGKMLVDPTASYDDALIKAAVNGRSSVVKLLLDLKDKNGKRLFGIGLSSATVGAHQAGHHSVVDLLHDYTFGRR